MNSLEMNMSQACRAVISLVLFSVLAVGLSTRGLAAIIETDASSTSETNFDGNILINDLIQNAAPTLASYTFTPGASFAASGANDGTATHNSGLVYYGGPPAAGVDLTFTLQGSATGYDISDINGIYGWQDSSYRHAAQEWVVSVSTVANPTLTPLYTVVYTPFPANDGAAGSSQVTLTDLIPGGAFASGVTAINFHLSPYGQLGDPGYSGEIGVLREFDVTGTPTIVPEPGSIAMLGLGALCLLAVARRRRLA